MQQKQPWSPWPWSIVAFFVIFISGMIVFIVFATAQREDLVRADYYEEEIRYQEQIDRMNRTRDHASTASVEYDPQRQRITIALPQGHVRDASGQVHLYRPADAGLDQVVPLGIGSDGAQHLDATRLRPGLWKVQVKWSAAGQDYFLARSVVLPALATTQDK